MQRGYDSSVAQFKARKAGVLVPRSAVDKIFIAAERHEAGVVVESQVVLQSAVDQRSVGQLPAAWKWVSMQLELCPILSLDSLCLQC